MPGAEQSQPEFVPAAGVPAFTRFYDLVVDNLTGERLLRRGIVRAIAADNPGSVLEIGCGTGSLAVELADLIPHAEMTGIDVDPVALSIANAKDRLERVAWLQGSATDLPFEDDCFDCVAISLVMHHLMPEQQPEALREANRVLRRGGRLHILDFGRPRGMLPRIGSPLLKLLDGRANTTPIFNGELPGMIDAAGFADRRLLHRFGTPFGTIERFVATAG